MDKEKIKSKIKDKLSEELVNFVNFAIPNKNYSYEEIKSEINVMIRENLPKEPPFKNINVTNNEKDDGVIMEFELNPSYKFLLKEI